MKKYGALWHDINNLLSFLNSSKAVGRINDHYLKYGNDAPAQLLQQSIDKLQARLDKAK